MNGAVKPAQLEAGDLPRPRLEAGSRLVMDVGPHDFAVAVHALPPTESRFTRFWEKMRELRGRGETLHPEQLQISPPVPFEEFTPGEHAPLSTMYPVVLMENGTRFGVEVRVPTALVGQWSEERRRRHPDLGMDFDEIYQVRTSVGAVVRINGEPLGELRTEGLKLRPARYETFTVFSQDGDDEEAYRATTYDTGLLTKSTRALMTEPDQDEYQTEESNLVFYVTGEQGTKSNADFDSKKGLVQVVFIACDTNEERVLGIDDSLHAKMMRSAGGFGGFRGSPDTFGGPMRSFGGTLQGEVRYEKPKVVKRKIGGVSNIRPLAEANVVLVGEGGPIPGEMMETPQPLQS